jgi:hypothetical protein
LGPSRSRRARSVRATLRALCGSAGGTASS